MWLIIYMLFVHIIGDFLFQTNKMFIDKWWHTGEMCKHQFIYTLTFFTSLYLYPIIDLEIIKIIDYTLVITFYHSLSDIFSSWEYQRAKLIGNKNRMILINILDQLLHLFVLYYFLHLLY